MSRSKGVWILLLIAAVLAACQAAPTPPSVPTPAPAASQPGSSAGALPQTREEVPRITPDELRGLLASPRKVAVIDTRSGTEYQTAHIRGAINMPSAEVESRYQELPRTTKIVTYCA